ncbi:podocan [Menidia menidia]
MDPSSLWVLGLLLLGGLLPPVTPAPAALAPPPEEACPVDCSCVEASVDCAGVDLTRVPERLPPRTRQLSLQNNKIQEITAEQISHLNQLETLNLQNNQLSSQGFEDEGFQDLEQLAYLYLANNKLTAAPKVLPSSLVSADFAANQLTRIFPDTFGQKPRLRSVYLHNNLLGDSGLPDQMFNGSDGLEVLTLSSNALQTVPPRLPPRLLRLHLKSNRLQTVPEGAFSLLQELRELHLQDNQLSSPQLDQSTFSRLSSLECLDLSSNNLTEVPGGLPPRLQLLHLERNRIRSLPAEALNAARSLEYLLLQHNELRARSIHPQAFQGLKKLHTLHLYGNLLERVPRGLPRRARSLMLLHNSIGELGRLDLAPLHTLTELNLSYNRLTSAKVHRDAFRKLRLLEALDLSGNGLAALPLGLPRSLRLLRLKGNRLSSVPEGTLTGMHKLQKLVLSDNQLRLNSIYQGAWMELSALTTLDLSGNQLSHIPSDLPESLEYLHLQSNRISSVSPAAFEGTPNIKGIFLRFNRLSVESLDESSFGHLSSLQVLDLGTGSSDLPLRPGQPEEEEEEEEEPEQTLTEQH